VRLWSVARSPEEILAGLTSSPPSNSSGLALDLRFSEGTGDGGEHGNGRWPGDAGAIQ
jgi:hypothetical protein